MGDPKLSPEMEEETKRLARDLNTGLSPLGEPLRCSDFEQILRTYALRVAEQARRETIARLDEWAIRSRGKE